MATTLYSPFPLPPIFNSLTPKIIRKFHPDSGSFKPFIQRPIPISEPRTTASSSLYSSQKTNEKSLSVVALHSFIDLNLGNWTGSFYQFNRHGDMMNKVTTKLAVGSYGEDDLVSLIQTLYIKKKPHQALHLLVKTMNQNGDKIKETNMFTVDKYQQINIFPKEKAFALRYQTAGMLETVLRQGVRGEDDIGEEFPKNLKLLARLLLYVRVASFPWRTICEQEHSISCTPKALLKLLIFFEERGSGLLILPSLDDSKGNTNRIMPHIGRWKAHSVTKCSCVYGATIAEAATTAVLEMERSLYNKAQWCLWRNNC